MVNDLNQLLTSHSEELSNEDLMQLEEQKVADEAVAEQVANTQKRFMIKQTVEAFMMIEGCPGYF